jgi:adenosylmethionine-8-amino-7-oxononanoate aminotransferase
MRVCRAAKSRGVFLRPLGDTIILMPPLSVTEDEIATIVEAIELGVSEVCADAAPLV